MVIPESSRGQIGVLSNILISESEMDTFTVLYQTQELAKNYWLLVLLMDGSHGHVSTQGGPFGTFRIPIQMFYISPTFSRQWLDLDGTQGIEQRKQNTRV